MALGAALAGLGLAWRNKARAEGPALWLVSTPLPSEGPPKLERARAQAARAWSQTGHPALHEELRDALQALKPRLERARNPLVEDFDDTPLSASIAALRGPVQPAMSALSTLAQLLQERSRCDDRQCVHIAETCPSGVRCVPLELALRDGQWHVLVWPLAHALRADCTDTTQRTQALERLQRKAQRPDSTLAWALGTTPPTDRPSPELRELSGLAEELTAPLPPSKQPPWLRALADAHTQPAMSLPAGLLSAMDVLILPRLASADRPHELLEEVHAELASLACRVRPLSGDPPSRDFEGSNGSQASSR